MGDPPHVKFCIKKWVYPFWQIYAKKITNFGDFGGCKSDNGEIWREGTDLGLRPSRLIL